MAKRKGDPLAKRKDETDLQWRSRVARASQSRRVAGEDVVTPERLAKGDLEQTGTRSGQVRTYRQRSTSSLVRLEQRGVITAGQLASAQEVAGIVERIKSDVRVSTGSVSARVDCDSSRNSYGGESYYRVCLEQAYNAWRLSLPLPRALVLDMVCEDHQLAAIARRHNRSWPKAMQVLREALDAWDACKRHARDAINDEDVAEAARRAG